jgi:hypothetical protein
MTTKEFPMSSTMKFVALAVVVLVLVGAFFTMGGGGGGEEEGKDFPPHSVQQ